MPLTSAKPLMVHSGSWLASEAGVGVDTKWSGAKGFFSGEACSCSCSGRGDMLVSSYGAIRELNLAAGQFTGPGRLWMQTRNASALVGRLTNVLPFNKSGGGS